MLDRGVYLPCSQYEALFVSAAHTEADIDATIAAAREALAMRYRRSLVTTSPRPAGRGFMRAVFLPRRWRDSSWARVSRGRRAARLDTPAKRLDRRLPPSAARILAARLRRRRAIAQRGGRGQSGYAVAGSQSGKPRVLRDDRGFATRHRSCPASTIRNLAANNSWRCASRIVHSGVADGGA